MINLNLGSIRFYDDGTVTTPPPPPETKPETKTYNQVEFEKAIESERKQNQERNRQLLAELTSLKQTAQMSDEQRKALELRVEELNSSLMTKEELQKRALEETEKRGREQVENLTKEVSTWKTRYETTLIERALLDAASKEGAYDPNMFVKLLRDNVTLQLDEQNSPKITIRQEAVKDGKPVQLTLNPEEAIKHMKSQSDKFGFLFRAEKTPGTGGNNTPVALKNIDPKSMTIEQYRELRNQIKSNS